jgi:hypothetical protein
VIAQVFMPALIPVVRAKWPLTASVALGQREIMADVLVSHTDVAVRVRERAALAPWLWSASHTRVRRLGESVAHVFRFRLRRGSLFSLLYQPPDVTGHLIVPFLLRH